MNILQNNIFSKEIKLLLLCSKINVENKELNQINSLCARRINWNYFKALIIKHRVLSIVYDNLKTVKNAPEHFVMEIRTLSMKNAARSFFFTTFLQKLIFFLNKNNIFIIPFKGPLLSEQIYENLTFRAFSDLDILVDKRDVIAARRLLKKKGFVESPQLNDRQFKKYIKNEDHAEFYNSDNQIKIELHWELSGLYLPMPMTISDVQNEITTYRINAMEVPCFSKEMLLVYLCIHGSKHGWEYLEQSCSVAEIIKKNRTLNWEKINRISCRWRCRKLVLLGLFLSERLLKAPVPDVLLWEASENSIVVKMADKVIHNLFKQSITNTNDITDRFSSFHITIRDSFKDKIRYFLRLIFRPTDKEWTYFSLPAFFSFFHYFLRPLRLTVARLRGYND